MWMTSARARAPAARRRSARWHSWRDDFVAADFLVDLDGHGDFFNWGGERPRQCARGSEFAVVAFFERVEQVGGGVGFAVVFDLFVALGFDHGTVFELEAVAGVFQIRLLDQHALEGGRIEAERGAAFQPLS